MRGCYYQQSLAFKIFKIKYLGEYVIFQGLITNKPSKFISLYFSPTQPTDKFCDFLNNLELTLQEVAKNNYFQRVVCKLVVFSYASSLFLSV